MLSVFYHCNIKRHLLKSLILSFENYFSSTISKINITYFRPLWFFKNIFATFYVIKAPSISKVYVHFKWELSLSLSLTEGFDLK